MTSFVIASNRGPLSFRHEHGELVAARGAGGLVSGLGPLVQHTDTTWVAAALSDADRAAAGQGVVETEGFRVRMLDIDADDHRAAYDVVCNATLWFLHHGLFDRVRQPRFGRAFADAWAAYERMNTAFADGIAAVAPDGAAVLVQDYHLALVGAALAERRPDLRTVHFSHTPFAGPEEIGVLPPRYAERLLSAMAAHRACGFHTQRWAEAFTASVRAVTGASAATFVAPLAADPDDIGAVASSPACDDALTRLESQVGDRLVVARVDRIELSKNLLRGFEAFELLLDERPEWHDRVCFVASVYPSREGLASYLAYRTEVETRVRLINDRFATATWTPIVLDTQDDFPTSVAVLRRSDVLLVNPIRDGLNLVAKESALVNERDGVLLLSPEAGIHDELGEAAITVHPYDVAGTADQLGRALRLSPDERRATAARLRKLAAARTPADWLADQLGAAR